MPKANKNLTKRNGVYYLRLMVDGKRFYRSLRTADKQEATSRARLLKAQLEGNRYTPDIDEPVRPVTYSLLSDLCSAYRAAARSRGLRPATTAANVRAFHNVLDIAIAGPLSQRATTLILTPGIIRKYVDAQLVPQLTNGAEQRRRRSIRSTLRQAKSLFARWVRPYYADAGIILPDLDAFMEAGNELKVAGIVYRVPPSDLRAVTLREAAGLAKTAPDLYVAFLLCYHLALRSGEAVAAKWDWIRQDDTGRYFFDVIDRDDFTPKGKERTIPMHEELVGTLQDYSIGKNRTEWILPGATQSLRTSLVQRRLADWLRSLGWDRETYPKAAHELRKLMGSRWYTELGAEVAQSWLGHTNIATTCRFYAALDRQPEPLPLDVTA